MSRLLSSKLELIREGLLFWWCPGCHTTHPIYLNVPQNKVTWDWDGDVWKPTFNPSFLTEWNQADVKHVCHTFIHGGKVIFLADCTHPLAGQTVDLPDIPEDEL